MIIRAFFALLCLAYALRRKSKEEIIMFTQRFAERKGQENFHEKREKNFFIFSLLKSWQVHTYVHILYNESRWFYFITRSSELRNGAKRWGRFFVA